MLCIAWCSALHRFVGQITAATNKLEDSGLLVALFQIECFTKESSCDSAAVGPNSGSGRYGHPWALTKTHTPGFNIGLMKFSVIKLRDAKNLSVA